MLKRHKGSFAVGNLKLDDPKFETTEFGQKIGDDDFKADADADVETDAVDANEDTGLLRFLIVSECMLQSQFIRFFNLNAAATPLRNCF